MKPRPKGTRTHVLSQNRVDSVMCKILFKSILKIKDKIVFKSILKIQDKILFRSIFEILS